MKELKEILSKIEFVAKEVGEYQKINFGRKDLKTDSKTTDIDLVTEVDKESEKRITEYISKNFPEHSVLGEEGGETDNNSDYLWVIDPLDGTINYSQGLPVFAISIALQYKKETILGVVHAPFLSQTYTAVKGDGAYLNGKIITVGNKEKLNQSVIATGFPYDRAIDLRYNNANYAYYFIPKVKGIRRMGAAAYDLCCVASGALDGYWEMKLKPWDMAAGELIVKEAGGEVFILEDKPAIALIAGNKYIVNNIYNGIKEVDANDRNTYT